MANNIYTIYDIDNLLKSTKSSLKLFTNAASSLIDIVSKSNIKEYNDSIGNNSIADMLDSNCEDLMLALSKTELTLSKMEYRLNQLMTTNVNKIGFSAIDESLNKKPEDTDVE